MLVKVIEVKRWMSCGLTMLAEEVMFCFYYVVKSKSTIFLAGKFFWYEKTN